MVSLCSCRAIRGGPTRTSGIGAACSPLTKPIVTAFAEFRDPVLAVEQALWQVFLGWGARGEEYCLLGLVTAG